jgi:hypothetical protein
MPISEGHFLTFEIIAAVNIKIKDMLSFSRGKIVLMLN